jgi:hypothetical protein
MKADEVRAWKKRWELVNAREIEELRQTPMEVKFQQLASPMAMARELGWVDHSPQEVAEVRERWIRLRKAYLDSLPKDRKKAKRT